MNSGLTFYKKCDMVFLLDYVTFHNAFRFRVQVGDPAQARSGKHRSEVASPERFPAHNTKGGNLV